ncbi:aminotransferase class I/II-fold pyridoxal phosphate-dependent enzyme [Leptolyngbya sp. FACHB-16]|nr:aminotransferase class I/II-fold pyridoxal phosphate-dependent enzyme [Leptolyngbya sp. FACHB-8]MBD2156121.1 aminotransferase class I/II-fold pyridoxal phosphate-dependent enzyme [Leptolyngbya sp. FACHB-16]
MDSLMAVELTNRLQSSLGCAVAQSMLFDYPTVEALTVCLLSLLAESLSAQPRQAAGQAPMPASLTPAPASTPPVTPISQPPITSGSSTTIPQPLTTNGFQNGAIPQPLANNGSQTLSIPQPLTGNGSQPAAIPQPFNHLNSHSPSQNGQRIAQITAGPSTHSPIYPSAPSAPLPDLSQIPPAYYQLSQLPEYLALRQDLDRVEPMGNPFFDVHDGIMRDTSRINGRVVVNYSSYNYVGMSGDLEVSQAAMRAIAQYGTSVSASRVVSGERPLHRELEREIADFLGTEDCIVFIGGHPTNVTTIGHLMGDRDLILCDSLSHNSLREGCKLSGSTLMDFPHNDCQALETILQQHRLQYEKVLIVVEGVYSTDGDIAPLPEIVALKHRYKTLLLVDEAHSIGVLGDTGRGVGEHFGVARTDVDLWMGTMSKALASCGGYIAGCKEIVEYLKYTAPGFVFSVGMAPPSAAAALAALRRLKAEPERVATLRARSQLFLQLARQKGLNTGMSRDTPVIPIIVGEPHRAVMLAHVLLERGINARPMVYPSVPFNGARLRFFLTSLHTEAQIRSTINVLAEELARL